MWRVLYILAWVLTLIAVVAGQNSPPVITYFLTKDLVNPEDVKFNADEGFRLPCKATGANLKWSWKHNDTEITPYPQGPYTITEDGTLIGRHLRAANSGTYQCFVKDEKTGAVAFSRKLKVAVTVVGAFINPTDVVMKVNLGDPFTFDCPPRKHSYGVVFSWGNADGTGHYTFARNDRRSISSNGTLFITYLTQQDIDDIESYKGIRCIISGANSFQRSGTLKLEKIDKNQTDSENSTLPAWSLTPHKQEIAVQGRNKTLYCLATGRPSPKITWKKDGDKIEHSQNSFKISRSFYGRLLFIMNINKEEHEGTYTCEAENDLNEGSPLSFSTALTVEVPPKWTPSPPPKNISVVIETNSTLECHVTADPAPAITWYKDGEELQPSKHHILDGGNLHLAEVTLDDAGIYQCEAANVHGMIISSTSLNVLAWKPSFDNAQFGPFHLLNEKEARLPCQPTTAAPRPTFQWFREGEMLTYNESSRYRLEKDGTLVIKEVDKDHDAVAYTCTAMNLKGEASVSAVLDVLVPPELSVKPGDQTIIEGTTVELHCNATGNPTPKITWSKDGKTVVKGDTLTLETLRNHSGKYWCTAENGLNVTVNASATLDVLFSPSLTTKPSDQTVVENEEVVFSCSAIGNPAPKVTWMKDGKTVGTEETLRFEASRDHSGDYWCSAGNGLGLAVNASAHLDVQFSPRLSTKPSDRKVVENEEVTFTCAATGNPDPKITWIKNGKTVGLGNELSFVTDRNHSGEYWCTADNGVDEAVNASAFLEVQFSPTLTTKPSTQRVIENEKVTFHCSATGNPAPNITWTKDGKIVGKGDTLSFVTDRNRSGEYWCSAENGLRTIANASAVLDVLYPPSVTTQPSDKTVIENEEATLHCKAIGNPVPEIIWLKDGDIVGSGETLNIEALRRHSGKYWCSADNGLGASVNASANLDVQFPPSLTTQPKDQTVLETAVAMFFCNATGNPAPNITWTKDGMVVGKGDTLSFVTNRNKSGEYWCSADNGLDLPVNASAKLDVQFPPTFTSKPSDRIAVENEKVTFYCKAIGNPVPEITWINDGTTVGSGDTLNIEALRSHSGKYWCSADNGLGPAVNASVDLNVKFPPSLTTQPKDQIVLEAAVATFYCNATGNPAPNITWTKDGMTVGKGETLSFVTKRNQSGEYWCSADNGLDLPVNASAKLDVQFPPSLTSKPSDQTVVENEEVTFHCTAVGNPVPKIIWVKDGTTVGSEDTLNIKALRSHSGKYWCSADNGLGAAVNASAALDVKFTPSLTSRPHDVTIIEGSTVTFHCNAIGNPAPKIAWTKDGKTVGTNDTLSFEALRSKSGKYWCSADNGLNSTVNASAIVNVQFYPSFTAKPSDQTVVENQQVTFNCSAIGNPVPKITWMKDGKTVGSEDTLSFETKRYQSGKYWCSADNGLGGPVNVSADLNVLFPPRLTRKPSNQTVIETGTVTFYCNATGNPVPKITWTKHGKTVGTEDTLSFVTHRNHSGEYLCSADNGLNATVVASANVDVQFPPSLIIMPLDQTVIEKEQLTLHCAATGNPVPNISWSKDGKTVGEGDTLTLETLRSHSGKYWCTAENGLSVTVNASATLDVLFPPSLTTIPTNKTVVEGAIATLRCTATGNPTPNITWTKDGKTVSTAEALTFAAFRNQSGEYWCSAGNGINKAVNASAYLDVQFPPSLSSKPSDRTVVENEEMTLHCAATGNPVPKIRWIKDGKTVGTGEKLKFTAKRDHSGEYWCSVENELNITVNASANLNVQFPPSLITKPTDQRIIETDTATFHCNATGNPAPKITWTKDGKTVSTGDTLSFQSNRNDSGIYWCSAENGLNSTVNASVTLDVQFPPSLTTRPSDQTLIENQEVKFLCAAIGNPTPTITWIRDRNTLAEGETLSLKTNRSHSGKYWCSASNGLGAAVNASADLDVQFLPSLTRKPSNQTVIETGTVTFYCNATGNPVPKITWTKDGKTVGTEDTLRFVTHRNHSGEYLCSADNGLNATVIESANLDVQFPPSLITKPLDHTVVEKDQLTLHCAATGNPVPKISWSKDGKTVGEGNALTLKTLKSHSGKYWCTVENGLGVTVNASATLDVLFPPSLTTIPTNTTVVEGAIATLRCSATGNPTADITWTKDGKTVSTAEALTFAAFRNQSGEYWCSADNGINKAVNASAYLDVQFPPSLSSKPSDRTVVENEEITLHCAATGNPVPKIRWIKDGKTVGTGEKLKFTAKRDHSGEYWCSVENELNITVNASANLNVQFPPSLITKPNDQRIIETDTATFHCNATGNPAPKITWTKDGKTVSTGDTLSFQSNRNDSGIYWCSAENGLNSTVNASVTLDVQFPPSLTTRPSDQTLIENQEVKFLCAAIGNPTPTITWIRDGNTLAEGETLSLKTNRSHSGKYWCSASNGLGAAVNASADLDVQFLPSLTRKPSNQTVIETGTVTFYCNATGNPVPKITWTKDGKTVGTEDTLRFVTHRNHSGEYLCSADNGLNATVIESANLDVQFPPSLITKPLDHTVVEKDQLTLHCAATGNPVPKISWSKDGKTVGEGNALTLKTLKSHSGKYWCTVENGLGVTVNASATLDVLFPPSLTTIPTNTTVVEGAIATLRCSATGNPTADITWTKDGKTVSTAEALTFAAFRNQSGEYWCSADNGINKAVNASAYLDVQFPPSLSSKPSDRTVVENEEITLHCAATGNPVPKIRWIKDGKTVGTGEKLKFTAKRDHSGEYWCSVENELNITVNASANLDVQFPPSLITKPTDQRIIETDTATFHCNATGNPAPKITWTKDGKTVSTGDTLSFQSNRNDSGMYWCSAENGLNSTVNASVTLDVQFPPSLTTRPSDQTLIENQEVKFLCAAIGNPTPTITWIRDGNTLAEGETLSLKTNRSHSGKYWCSASNGLGAAVNASADLDVQFLPSIKSKPENKTIIEGSTVTLYCNATGNPAPKITWTKDGNIVGTNDSLSFEAKRNHSGKYWCSADNGLSEPANPANASADVDVQFFPSIITKPSNQTVYENQSVTIHCSATGNPVPRITWIKDGKTVGTEDILSLEVKREHSGEYWCHAENGLNDTVKASAHLNVQYAPNLTSRPSDKTITEGATVIFHCNATGNPTPKISWTKDGKTVGTNDTLSFVTDRNHSGQYWCSAENGLNVTVKASAKLDVQFPPALTIKPTDQTVTENEQSQFHCTAIGNPVPKITWIKDGKTVGNGDSLNIGVQRKDSGKYWCSADNGLGQPVNASAELDVHFPPSLLKSPTNKTILEGTNVTFMCTATGNPTPKIEWLKDGMSVASGGVFSFVVNRNHSGKYWCSVDNGLSAAVNASAELDVQFPPNLITKPSDKKVIENEQLQFRCTATGNPVPKIRWMKDGKTVGFGEILSLGAQRNQSGKYWCSVDNGLSNAVNASADLDVQFAPTLLTRPTDQIILEGFNVTFRCLAIGNPIPTIKWFKDGKTVGSGETLSFVANRIKSGKYWCSADNGLGATFNASANLDVQFFPSLTSEPADQTVTEKAEVVFHCSAIGNPLPKITWVKDDKTVATGNTLSFEAFRNHSGEYWCSVDNGLATTANTSAVLVVQYAPSLITKPTSQTVIEADNATFQCIATGNPIPTITWIKDGKTVTTGEKLSFEAFRNNSGEYWCSADNGLNSTVNASAYLNVQFLPSLTTRVANQTVNETAKVTFHCSATGNPVPKITWYKDGNTVGSGSKLSFTAMRNHSGKYWCLANNGLNATVNSIAYLNVQFPPSFMKKPIDKTVTEFDETALHCTAIGNPVPEIKWIKDGKTVGKGSTLNLKASRNKTGEYWCWADNGLGKAIKAESQLDVQFPPSLSTTPDDQILDEKTTTTFRCTAAGNPVPKITWTKDGKTMGTGNVLRFETHRNHSGKYWCTADNGFNKTVNASAQLDVLFPPSITTQPTGKAVIEGTIATFHCNANGNPVPKITWTKDGKTVSTESTLSFVADRNHSGEYWCSADNGLNTTVNASAYLDVLFPPSLATTPDDQLLKENTTVTFHCTAVGNPVPKITWAKDGKTVGTGNVLRFETHRNHSGKYWCTADNGFNKTVNASAQLDVLFPPSITTQPTGKAVIEGTIATFHCNANGNPVPKITWTKDSKTVSTESTLSFVADKNHSGEYWCSADNGLNTTVNASAYLEVLFPPSLTTTPDDQILNEKTTATFHCTAVGNPVPKITWTKDEKTVGIGNVLRFETHRNHSGKYWCTADNGFNKTVNSSAQLNVLFPPTLTTQPTDKAVIESTVATFHCNATGRPVPKITWTKDGKTVSTESTLSFVADRNHSGEYWCSADNGLNTTANASAYLDVLFSSSLTMKPHNTSALEMEIATFYCSANGNPTPKLTWSKDGKTVGEGETLNITVNRNDSGKYWCAADNGLREAVNASAYLDVQFLPSFATMPVNQTVNEGDKATFYCTTIGNPVPKITWSKDGKTVSTEDKLSFVANRSHSGEYWCSAENGIGLAINASVYLDVQFAPVLTETPTEQTITAGDKATFHCTASGNPAPKIKWVKDGSIVGAGETLTFDAVRDNFGEYWCVAENSFSDTANASAYLDVQFPPSFTSIPSDQIVTETDLTTFTCAASGNPVPNITWVKDGTTVATGDTLSFEASRNHSGTYWCLADNGIGAKINTSVSLNVQFSPSLDMQPTNQTVIEGAMATLYCNATGNPSPRIRWIKDGKTVGGENTLTFVTRRNSSGKYWCSAENGFKSTVKAIAYLNVLFPPSFTSTPNDQTVKEGAEATLLCVATGNPSPEIRWHREGKIVAIGDTLRLMAANRNDTGKYWCSADNGLSVNITSSVHLDVQFAPRLTTRPTDQTVVEADQAAFHCAATGNPRPKITWSKDAKTVGIGEKLSFEATRNHSGKYWCSADNGLQPSDNASAVLDVQFPPRFALRPVDQTIKEGDIIAFHCNATGNPVPNITWTKDGATVGKGDTLSLVTSRNDTGEYQCLADNGIDANITTSVSLDVQFPPRLTARPADQTLIEGVVVTFLCSAIGNPPPRITWTKDSETVGTEDTLSFVTDRNQSGEYWCSADNGMNTTVRASANLDVQFPPHFTTKPVDQTVDESEDTTFHCTATGNPVPTITWIRDGKPVAKGDTLSFEAARNRSGEYWCSANNGLGVPINASAQLEVRFSPSWTKRPADQTVVEGVVATLYCTATGHPTPKITWTKDGKVVGNENVLSFTSSRGHAGEYWCSAENGLGKAINASAYLDVQHPSSLTSTPTDQTVKEGDETTLHCAASGNPTPNITWIKDGKTVGSGDTLKFQATRNRSGKYWCLADNGLGFTVNASAHLNVQFPPHVTIKTSYLAVKEGNTATFQCTATGNPAPRITWSKDGENLYTGDTLSFDANRNHSGEYWCSAENGFNKTARASSYLDVHFKPERTRLSVNIDIAKAVPFGSFVEFNCTTFSNPDADGYKFYRDQEPLGSNTSGVYHLQLQRSGLYSCVPFNSVANGNRAVLRINVNAWKPSFDSVQFGPFYLFKGIQARLPCKPFAEPYPTFTWLKDGAVIKHGKNESYRIDADGSLIIVKVKDGDSGKYTCMAENYLGKANATADGILLERTQIIVRPQNMTVTEGSSVDLRCKATADPLLELTYIWKRDGADITDESNIQWQEGGNVLKLSDISFEEAGVYTCVAYTPQPRGSEDNATAVVSIIGVPPPPNNIKITDCYSTRTNISWSPVLSNNTRITHYLIEQESNHEPFVFKLIYNVTNPDVTSVSLALPGWATLRFRVRTVNSIGPSRPSEPTAAGICTTPVGTPQSYPRNLRGVPKKANELAITWTPMSKTEWNAQGCYYIIKYRKVNLGYLSDWMVEKISDPSVDLFAVSNAGYYQLWEFKIRAGNHEGLGPESPVRRSFSGQNAPVVMPESTEVEAVTASSVALTWKPVTVSKGSVDGYKIYYWGESRSVISRRRRQAIPSTADFIIVMGGKTQQATLTGLKPYTNYRVVVKAFNTGGEGPASAVMIIETLEGEPGPPSGVQIYPFGEFILVKWKPPKEPNGIITSYQVGSAEINGSSPENVPAAMETVGPNVFKKLLSNHTFEKSYVVEIRAQTSKGWGESARETTRTIKKMAPAKPEKPTAVATGKDVISVMYNFGVGGGWTHEFKVLYRKKEEGGKFLETDWVDHFSTQWTEIKNLEPEVYELKTVGKNTAGTSPESDVTEARPEQGPVISGQQSSPPVYRTDWFMALIIASACTLLILIAIVIYRRWKRRRSSSFKVTEQEKEMEKEQVEQGVPEDVPVKRHQDYKKTLQDKLEEASQDSLDEYAGQGAYFTEDGSFVGDLEQGQKRESVYDEIPDPVV